MSDLRSQGVPADALEGTPYRPLGLLGKGGMAYVLDAEDTRDGRNVVVKILQPSSAADDSTAARFRAEAAILSDLRHPNLVEVHDSGVTAAGHGYVVMERLRGHDLKEELKQRGALPVAFALELARQALAGLEALHRRGIIHRDVKPGNLFLCDHPDGGLAVKVVDLGIAKLTKNAEVAALSRRRFTSPGELVGTPWYMAPELLLEQPASPAVDVYAMGLVMYRMLTGQHPFADCRALDAMWLAHLSKLPQPPSEVASQPITPALDRMLLRCLAKEPEERFADATALSAALGRVVSALAAPGTLVEHAPDTPATAPSPEAHATVATRVDTAPTIVDAATAPRPAQPAQLHTLASPGVDVATAAMATKRAAAAAIGAQAYAQPMKPPAVPPHAVVPATPQPAAEQGGLAGRILAIAAALSALLGFIYHSYATATVAAAMVNPARMFAGLVEPAFQTHMPAARWVLGFELARHGLLSLFAIGVLAVAASLVAGRRSRVSDGVLTYVLAVITVVAALVLDVMNNGPRLELMNALGEEPPGPRLMLGMSIAAVMVHSAVVGLLFWASRVTPPQA